MNLADRRLVRHLAIAVVVKLALLSVLWWLFARDAFIHASADETAAHIANPAHSRGASR